MVKNLLGGREDSHMHQHIMESHPELEGTFKTAEDVSKVFSFQVLKKHPNSLNMEISEAVKIIRAGTTALNNKEEYSRSSIPTIQVTKPQPTPPEPAPTQAELEELEQGLEHLQQQKIKRPRTRTQASCMNKMLGTLGTTQNPASPANTQGNPNKRTCRNLRSTKRNHKPHKAIEHLTRSLKRDRTGAEIGDTPDLPCSPAKKPSLDQTQNTNRNPDKDIDKHQK